MDIEQNDKKVEEFNRYRSRLFGIGYRMLGTRDYAEDIVQETYIRWHKATLEEIETPEAWLVTAATRLSIDRLRKAAHERETYIGPWLPEPLIMSKESSPQEQAEFASDLSVAFLALLERLSPVERAAFLLHDIFDCAYPDVARITGKTEPAVRQMIHRARERVRNDRARYETSAIERDELMKKFAAATATGDERVLLEMFAPDILLTSDGGGKVTAARKLVTGKARIARLYHMLAVKYGRDLEHRVIRANGGLAMLTLYQGKPQSVISIEAVDGKITNIYSVLNPDKLKSLE